MKPNSGNPDCAVPGAASPEMRPRSSDYQARPPRSLSWLSALSLSGIQRSLRVGIVGASGSGKTCVLREWMNSPEPRNARLIAYDPFGHLPGLRVGTARAALRAASRPASCTTLDDPDLFGELLPTVCQLGACTLVVDEAQDVFPRNSCPLARLKAIQQGRNKGVGLIWSSQRPTRCNVDLTGNSQGMIIGTLLAGADMATAREWGIPDPMPQHSFFVRLPEWSGVIQSRPMS